MRAWILTVAILIAIPAVAAKSDDEIYIVTGGGFGGGGGTLIENGETFFPEGGWGITVNVTDRAHHSVFVVLCHEWTYNDGSHPTVTCVHACTDLHDDLRFPPDPGNTVYRVIIDLRQGPGDCKAAPVAGQIHVEYR